MRSFTNSIRGTLIGALALTGAAAAPAKAGDADAIAALLFGAATVAIIANEVKKDKKSHSSQSAQTYSTPRPTAPRACLRKKWTNNGWVTFYAPKCVERHNAPKHVAKPPRKPRECLRKKWTENGWEKFYSKRCLRDHRINEATAHASLPQQCKRTRWKNGRQQIVYPERCLARFGYN